MDPRTSAWGSSQHGNRPALQPVSSTGLSGSQSAAILPSATPTRGYGRERPQGRQPVNEAGRKIPELSMDTGDSGGSQRGSRPTSALDSARRGGGSLADIRRESRRQSRAMIEAEQLSNPSDGMSREESLGRDSSWGREGSWGRGFESSGGIPAAHRDASPASIGRPTGQRDAGVATGMPVGLAPVRSQAGYSPALPATSSSSTPGSNRITSTRSHLSPSDRSNGRVGVAHSHSPMQHQHRYTTRDAIPVADLGTSGLVLASRASSTPSRMLGKMISLPPVKAPIGSSPLGLPAPTTPNTRSTPHGTVAGHSRAGSALGAGGRGRGNMLSGASSQRGGFLRQSSARGGLTPSRGGPQPFEDHTGHGNADASGGGNGSRLSSTAGVGLRRAPLIASLPTDDDHDRPSGFASNVSPHAPQGNLASKSGLGRPSPVTRGRVLERSTGALPVAQGMLMRPHAPDTRELQSQSKLRDDGDDLGEYDSDDDGVPQPTLHPTGRTASERPSPIDTQQRRRVVERQRHDDLMMGAHKADSDDDDDSVEMTPTSKQPADSHRGSASESKAKKPALAVDSGSGDRMDDGFGLQELPFAVSSRGGGRGGGGDGDDLDAFPDDDDDDAMDGEPISNARDNSGLGGMAILESSAPGSMGSTLGSTAISFAKTGTMGGGGTRLGLSMSGAGFDSTGGSFGGTGSSFGARRRKKGGGPSLLVSTGGGLAAPGVIEPAAAGLGIDLPGGGGSSGLELQLPGAKYDGSGSGGGGIGIGGDLDDTMNSTGIAERRRKRAGGPSLDLSMSGSLARKRGMALSLDTGGNPGATGGMLEMDAKAGDDAHAVAVANGNLWSTGQSPTTGTGTGGGGGGLDSAFVDGDPFSTPQGHQASGAAQAALDPKASELSDAGTLRIGGIFEVNAGGILVSNPATVAAQAVLAAIEGGFDGSDSEETTGEMKEAMAKLKDGSQHAWLNESLAKALARAAVDDEEQDAAAAVAASADSGWGPRSIRDELVMMDALGSGASGSVQRALHIPSLRMVAVKSVRVFEAKNREQMAAELKLLYANITKLPDIAGASSKPLVQNSRASSAGKSSSGVPASIAEDGIASAAAAAAAASSSSSGVGGPLADHVAMAGTSPSSLFGAEADGTGSELCPNIVRLYDAYSAKDQGSVCIVMEYMAGGSLQDLVDGGGTQNMAELATIAMDTFRGLAFLHSQRQLHRDIKPANILRSHGGGECKLADFGIAKQLEGTMDMAQTWVGTMQYMSPERIDQDGDGYSYPADIWSLGLTLLAVAAGKFPYTGGQDYFAMMGAVKEEAPPLECLDVHDTAGRTISPEFRDLITRSLTKDPHKRITAAEALSHPFMKHAWRPTADGGGRAAGLTLRALTAPKPPWASAYKRSHDKNKKIKDQVVKLLRLVCQKHFKVFARFHARGTDAATAQKQRLGQRLDDSTFNRHKAERLLVSAGATGDFSYLAGDARTMGFLSRVAHAKALQTAGVNPGGLSQTALRRHATSDRMSNAGGDRLEVSSEAVVAGAAAAASRAVGGLARGLGPARRSAASFDAFTSDPMTRHGRQLLMRSLAGKVSPDELGEDGVKAMSKALRVGAARVMEAWVDEEDNDEVVVPVTGAAVASKQKKNHKTLPSGSGATADGAGGDSMGSSGLVLSGLTEFGVHPTDSVQVVMDKVPVKALLTDEASVRILADQVGLRPAVVADLFVRVVEAWYRRHQRKKQESQALAQAAKSTLASPGRPSHSGRGASGGKRPPSKQLPVPTPPGRQGVKSGAVQISEQAGSNVIQFGDETTTIKVMNTSSSTVGKTVSVAGVDTLIRHYGNK